MKHTTTIGVDTQDANRPEAVDYEALKIGEAQPNNLAGHANVWTAEAIARGGERYAVHYSFSDAEIAAAGDDAGELPWDASHVVRITRKD